MPIFFRKKLQNIFYGFQILEKYISNCSQISSNCSQISEKNTNIHVGWAYTVHTTCIPLELYTGVDVGVHGPTTDVRACILDDRDLERWSTSMWWGPAARLARPTDGAPRPCDS